MIISINDLNRWLIDHKFWLCYCWRNGEHIPFPLIEDKAYTTCVTLVNDDMWFEVYNTESFNNNTSVNYLYSSQDLRLCFDFCNKELNQDYFIYY